MARMTKAEQMAALKAKMAKDAAKLKEIQSELDRQAAAKVREHERALGALVLRLAPNMTPERLQSILESANHVTH